MGLPLAMSEHFRAFSFVDRIVPADDGSRIEGYYVVPADVGEFPPSLAGEAVGQLAAWAAMKATDFERRPVAGIAGRIDFFACPRPGQVLRLVADIESLDSEAVAYRGSAMVDGTMIIGLEECVGPMIPVTDLDDPGALRERFAVLRGPGACPGAFRGLPTFTLEPKSGEKGTWTRATFQVPASAAMFADHFPRRPVFPGSLLVQVSLQLAGSLTADIPAPVNCRWKPRSVMGMKLREFIPPGRTLELEARLKEQTETSATIAIAVRAGEEVVGNARLQLSPEVRA